MTKNEAIVKFLYLYKPNIEEFFALRVSNGAKVTLASFINILSQPSYNFIKDLGITGTSATKLKTALFPEKITKEKLCTHLLAKYNHKVCSSCLHVYSFEEFFKDKGSFTKYSEHCKYCIQARLKACPEDLVKTKERKVLYRLNNRHKFNEWEARRRARKLQAIPKWADLEKIKEIYKNCPEGHEVDHYYPLLGALVCGLHVETNLQYLTSSDNRRKGNSMPT